ncbi:hypothetical protein ABDK00_014035 [Niabella insulamsoli]|uniref:hypothetical protein n=1 Tax=Niabella insulamsoli TaxID=3144874 RepID=UPI0031FC18DA
MPKLGTLLEKLFKKVGIEITDELKSLTDLENEVGEDQFKKVDEGLLSITAAKSHPDVLKQLRQNILGVADTQMDNLISELGITVGEDFANEKNTYERISKLVKAAAAAQKKAGKPDGDFAAKEAEYNKQLKDLKDLLASKETEFKTTRETDLTSFELQKILLGKDYVFPKEMDRSIAIQTALAAVNNDLLKKGFNIKRDESGQLVVVNKEGLPAFNSSNEAVEPNTYIDGVLAQNKLLKVSDPNPQPPQPGSTGVTIPGGNKNVSIVNDIDAQLASMS